MGSNLQDIMVSICCVTYNHEHYIKDCLDGFLMQKTNFPFEVLIHDDASTDTTADIIRRYEAVNPAIKAICQTENQFQKGVQVSRSYQFPRAAGKYLAFCEGDDYWTDPFKLQKQIDFLESHPDYALIHTGCEYIENKKIKIVQDPHKVKTGFVFNNLLCHDFFISTPTVCVRKNDLLEWYNILDEKFSGGKWRMGDLPLWIEGSLHTKFAFLPDITAHYRIVTGSISHSDNVKKNFEFFQSVFEIKHYFAKRENVDEALIRKINVHYNRLLLSYAFHLSDPVLGKKAVVFLKKNKVKLRLRELLYYWGSLNRLNRFSVKIVSRLRKSFF
jgi:glycosyltransferase involved in cell wall biosynthesis